VEVWDACVLMGKKWEFLRELLLMLLLMKLQIVPPPLMFWSHLDSDVDYDSGGKSSM